MNKRKDINQMNLDEFIDYLRGKSTPKRTLRQRIYDWMNKNVIEVILILAIIMLIAIFAQPFILY
jgi:hypothetical protein